MATRTTGVLASGALCLIAVLGCDAGRPSSPAVGASTVPGPASAINTALPSSMPSAPTTAASPTPDASEGVPSLVGTLACSGTDTSFPAGVLNQLPLAELGLDAPASALRAYLGSEAAVQLGLPEHGWRTAITATASVTFVAPNPAGWSFATITPSTNGVWQFWEGGRCDLAVRLPETIGFATWRLDPARPVDPGASTVPLLARELACAGGQVPGARMLAPIVLEADSWITIALVVGKLPGDSDCQANPEVPMAVALPSHIGSRTLLDGSSFPAKPRS